MPFYIKQKMSKFAAINSKPSKQVKSKTMVPLHNSMSQAHAPGTVPIFNQQQIDEEVARAVQQILSVQNEQTETVDENIYLNSNDIVPSNDLSTSMRSVSGNSHIEDPNYKTLSRLFHLLSRMLVKNLPESQQNAVVSPRSPTQVN